MNNGLDFYETCLGSALKKKMVVQFIKQSFILKNLSFIETQLRCLLACPLLSSKSTYNNLYSCAHFIGSLTTFFFLLFSMYDRWITVLEDDVQGHNSGYKALNLSCGWHLRACNQNHVRIKPIERQKD